MKPLVTPCFLDGHLRLVRWNSICQAVRPTGLEPASVLSFGAGAPVIPMAQALIVVSGRYHSDSRPDGLAKLLQRIEPQRREDSGELGAKDLERP